MEDDTQTKPSNGVRERFKKSSKGEGERVKSRERKHRRSSSSNSSSSRSRSKDRKSKKNTKKGRSSRYSSSSNSSSRSRSSSRSSSSSKSRTYSRERIKKKNFDRPPTVSDMKSGSNTGGFQGNNQFSGPIPGQSGAAPGLDLVKGRTSSGDQQNFAPSFAPRNRPDISPATQHARRVYVGNIPPNLVEPDFVEYMYRCLEKTGGLLEPGNPIISTKPDMEKKYIFLEFRSIEETSACMQLDGITYDGKILRLRRPKQYDLFPKIEGTRPVPTLDLSKLENKFGPAKVEDGPAKLFIGGIPHSMDEATVTDMLRKIGPLKSFQLVRDKFTNVSKGFGFCEYFKESDAIKCIESLNGMNMGYNRILQVKRSFNLSDRDLAGPGGNSASNLAKSFLDHFNSATVPQSAMPQQAQPQSSYVQYSSPFMDPYGGVKRENPNQQINQTVQSNILVNSINVINPNILNINTIHPGAAYEQNVPQPDEKAVNVLCLGNILDRDEIENDQEFDEVYEDIMNEMINYGQVQSMIIPRRKDGYEGSCLGKVYVEFDDVKAASQAKATIKAYKYGGRPVEPTYYELPKFMDRILM